MGLVICGDSLELLKDLPSNSVDAIPTDPPYGLHMMGRDWDKALPDPRIWAECLRVLKPGGYLPAFGAPRLYHRLACQIEDVGFELRDCLQWLYGSGFPKGGNLPGGCGTALKPAYEPIAMFRKPLIGTVAENRAAYGTGMLHIDAARIGGADGRWPANVALDPEAGAILDAQTGTLKSGDVTKRYDPAMQGSVSMGDKRRNLSPDSVYADAGGASRFFYCGKASRAERELGLEHRVARNVNDGRATSIDNPFQRGDSMRANTHPTVKPVSLMRWLIRLVSAPEALIVDPFTGSGTTGIAAALEGRRFVGYERDADHAAIAEARIWHAMSNPQDYDPDLEPDDDRQITIPGA